MYVYILDKSFTTSTLSYIETAPKTGLFLTGEEMTFWPVRT